MIDIAVPSDMNIILEELKKIGNYKEMEIEISRMWNYNTRGIPAVIVVRALGTIKIGFEQNLKMHPGHQSPKELQNISLLGTAWILRMVLSINCFELLLRCGFISTP